MRRTLTIAIATLFGSALVANGAIVGESPVAGGGSVDGWSGITILDGYGGLPAGELLTTVEYYADEARADGTRHVQPLIAQQAGDALTIWGVGPVDTPAAGGAHQVDWNTVIPNDGNAYHPAIWQWADGVDDTAGGVVPFNANGGSGMRQQNQDGTSYVPAVGDDLTAGAQHASGPGGRAYQLNFQTKQRFCATSTADFCFDFDANDEGATVFGDGEIRTSGGLEGGYLKVTDAANGQRGKVILPDTGEGGQFVFGGRTGGANAAHHIDNLEASVNDGRVEISAWLRVGGGTDRPADGFSFNFVRPGDPVLSEDTNGWAGIGGEPENLPEEGTLTGISIGFDEWQSGPAPSNIDEYTGANGAELRDVVGMSLRVDGKMVGQANLPTLNGAVDDPTSLQTGPNDDSAPLGWARLTISAPLEGANLENTVVTWKGATVNFVPEPSANILAIISLAGLLVFRRRK